MNRQEKVIWLAGLIDGDGCIGVHRQLTKGREQLVPQISISTTCFKTFQFLSVLFPELGIRCTKTFRKVTNPNWKDRWVLAVRGHKGSKKLLELISPYLVTKQEEGVLVLDFIKSRQIAPTRGRLKPYQASEFQIVSGLKQIKSVRNGGLLSVGRSETIISAPVRDEGIVRPA